MSFQPFHEPKTRSALRRESMRGKSLSVREQQVAQGIARGDPPALIATELGLSVKTIATYRSRILEKMEMGSNAELAVWFERQSQPDYRQALADLVAFVERHRDNSDGRWPEPDANCGVCSQGVSQSGELCAWHAAKQLVKS